MGIGICVNKGFGVMEMGVKFSLWERIFCRIKIRTVFYNFFKVKVRVEVKSS
jgi:hypothetical protein